MRVRRSNVDNSTTGTRRGGFLGKVFPGGGSLRFKAASRSPYRAPALVFGPGRFLALAFFAIGMAYLEAACVVYLWEILYPGGFKFPLLLVVEKQYEPLVAMEFGREFATIMMLAGCAIAAGRTKVQKVASFLFLFGIWDVFYYFWLRVVTELTHFPIFPDSLSTWDILFLIPVPWTGPVYAPMVVAATMVLFAVMLVFAEHRGARVKPDLRFWITEAIAVLMIFGSFIWNCREVFDGKVPSFYPWWLLLPAEIIAVTAFVYLIRDCFYSGR
jgi:hypothetical protein